MKHIIRLGLMTFLFITGLISGVQAQLRLKGAYPYVGDNVMEIGWTGSPGATEYEYRSRTNDGPWSPWTSTGTNTTTVERFLPEGNTYSYQVREKVNGEWSEPSNIKSNKFEKVWPVRKASDGVTEVLDLLHGFGQPYGGTKLAGTKLFHEGVDMQGESNVENEVVRAPVGGVVVYRGGSGPNIAVDIQVTLSGATLYIQFNHLKNLNPDLEIGETVEAGEVLGVILNSTTWGTVSSHTHCHFYKDRSNIAGSAINPFLIWDSPDYMDPYFMAPQVLDVNGDGRALRFRKTPDIDEYFPDDDKVHNGVDIEVEAVDKQSTDAPWQIPSRVGYFVERQVKGNWIDAVRSSNDPYIVFNSRYFYYSWFDHPNNLIINDIVNFKNDVKGKDPVTPPGYFWEQWFTYRVTSAKGNDGLMTDVDEKQRWATDARKTVRNANGYVDGYPLARIIDEAKFPDGNYRVNIRLEDLVNTAPDYRKEIHVDNFRPYAKKVEIKGGDLEYEAAWEWDENANQLSLKQQDNGKKVCGKVLIRVTMSEPMKDVTIEVPTLPFAEHPATEVGGSDGTVWEVEIPEDLTKDAPEGPHKVLINGHDKDDNALQGFTDKGVKTGDMMQKRALDGTWKPAVVPIGRDNIHEFKVMRLEVEVATTPPSSCGKKDGTATITVTSDPGPFEYSVDGSAFQSSNTFKNLAAGWHIAVVRKGKTGCEFFKDFAIEKSPNDIELTVSGYGTLQICEDQEASITLTASASGGSGNFDYNWPGGMLTVHSSGRYTAVATDKETGCSKSMGGDVVIVRIVCSKDPNDIVGPEGYGPGKMIAKSKSHSYTVRFENDPDFATAPAQVVKINHPLDSNVNPFSLRLGDFGFAGMTFSVPADKTFYTTRLNVMDSLGVVVDVTAGIDVTKKEAFWVFESKDPATGLPPANAHLGFLPINDSAGKGEGFVSYTIKAANHTKTGDSIHAKASIVFDLNAPIETPLVFNTIDALPPVSRVKALPVTSNAEIIRVSWAGEDDPGGSGVRDYMLYVSENGGAFRAAQESTADTAILFTGSRGHTYNFFTLATDNTGNAEAMKNAGEATVTISDCKEEVCNGVDDDCDGIVDEGCGLQKYYMDADGDGYGRDEGAKLSETPIPGWVLTGGDCADWDPAVHPGAAETANGRDDNCNGQADEGLTMLRYYMDVDGDGYGRDENSKLSAIPLAGHVLVGGDCADWDATVNPGAAETANGRDDNCNGQADEGLPMLRYYMDVDGDGYGRNDNSKLSAIPLAGHVLVNGDCADWDAAVHPGAPETANGRDDNCNGQVDEGLPMLTWYQDVDKDGYGRNEGARQSAIPLAGYVLLGGDCHDYDPHIYPGAPELVNGRDDNCNGSIDENLLTASQNRGSSSQQTPGSTPTVGAFNVVVSPIPSDYHFTVDLQQGDAGEKVRIRVFDHLGRLVETRENLLTGAKITLGSNYAKGYYTLEAVQGASRKLVKLIKL